MDTATTVQLRRKRGQAKSCVTKGIKELRQLLTYGGEYDAVQTKLNKLREYLHELEVKHDEYLAQIGDSDLEGEEDYYEMVAEEVSRVEGEVSEWAQANRPKDDDVESVASSRLSRQSDISIQVLRVKASAKKAALSAQAKAFKELQELELQELQCKHKRRAIELEIGLAEAEAEVTASSKLEGGENDIAYTDHSRHLGVQDGSDLNPQAPEWRPVTQVVSGLANQSSDEGILGTVGGSADRQQQFFEALQLPKMDIMSFNGDPLKYWQFIRSFENTVEKFCVSEEARLLRLVQCTTGRARQVIQCCCVMSPEQGYKRAKQLLKERFGNDYVITETWIKRITSFGSIKPADREKLREYADELKSCKETLKAMGRLNEVNNQTNLLRIVEKLPVYLQNSWRKEVREIRVGTKDVPNIEHLTAFIEKAADTANDPVFGQAAPVSEDKRRGGPEQTQSRRVTSLAVGSGRRCIMCNAEHTLFQCDGFRRLKVTERLQFVKQNKLCNNCLRPGHIARQCLSPATCSVVGCGKKHTKFLHTDNSEVAQQSASTRISENSADVRCATGAGSGQRIGLPIVPVRVAAKGSAQFVTTCALLDSGSTNTFCSEELRDMLGAKGQKESFILTTLDKSNSAEKSEVVSLQMTDVDGKYMYNLPRVYTRRTLRISMRNVATDSQVSRWPHLQDISLPNLDGMKVMLIIGQDTPEAMVVHRVLKGPEGSPYACNTPFGWTVNGPLGKISPVEENVACCNFISANDKLEQQIERFWAIEYGEDGGTVMSANDVKATSVWEKTIRLEGGHYELAIPFKQRPPPLPNNRELAEQRLQMLQRRLERDVTLKSKYQSGINELLSKGYAERVQRSDSESQKSVVWYLPHHPVVHKRKLEKVRIVFDCAAKFQGTSLNDQVLQGPDLTNALLGVLIRFRQEPIALMADVESMFHQVRVSPKDRDALRFLWCPGDPKSGPEEYRMTAHLFGGIWSPSCCNYVLRRTADDNKSKFSLDVTETVRKNFYVDDCLKSVPTSEAAISLVNELQELLMQGGFKLTKWLSNDRSVLQAIPEKDRVEEVRRLDLRHDVVDLPTERALGVLWDSELDNLGYEISVVEKPSTRRGILSIMSSVYDPLGFICPFVLPAKVITQELCRRCIKWDDRIPDDVLKSWNNWLEDLPRLNEVSLKRCIKPKDFGEPMSSQLHHFSDASSTGYGAVTYIRLVNNQKSIHCSMLMARSKLAPLKQMTIPRLELTAAVLAVKLDQFLRQELEIKIDESVFWTDSMSVLKYIRNKDKRFHVFVANRLAVIHSHTEVSQWHHVSTRHNPADLASRGIAADRLLSSRLWFCGPEFLWQTNDEWPPGPAVNTDVSAEDPEVKRTAQIYLSSLATGESENIIDRMIRRRSSWSILKRDVCYVLRMKLKLLLLAKKETESIDMKALITVSELRASEIKLVKYVERQTFSEEYESLRTNGCVKKSSSLRYLDPVVLPNGLLAVGGRLKRASIAEHCKHPVILPRRHRVTNLIVNHCHEMAAHSGREYVLLLLQKKYWIVGARAVIRHVLKNCAFCRRYNVKPLQQKMSDLPSARVTAGNPPFTSVGVDLFGPFEVKQGRSLRKRYGVVFVCLAIKAVHIEIVHSMDTDAFLNAMQRFMCRRGQPTEIWSDNGSNLVGANRELRSSMNEWNQQKVNNYLVQKDIQWHFNPPAASHMGGIWERQIRTIRKILTVLLNQQVLDDERLMTLMCVVESVVNNRPITHVSDDLNDCEALTPNHLLLLRPGPTSPPGVFVERDIYRRRWRQVQYLADVFWRRWLREYLPTLQQRQKWLKTDRNLQVDDVVVIVDYASPRNSWTLARVTEVFPGQDGLVRSARVKTATSTFIRPIDKLCLIEPTAEL